SFVTAVYAVPSYLFFFTTTPPSDIYTLSLHDALPNLLIMGIRDQLLAEGPDGEHAPIVGNGVPEEMVWDCVTCGACIHECPVSRSEEHTSELQSRFDLVCRLLLEKKNPGNHPDAPRRSHHGALEVHRRDRPRLGAHTSDARLALLAAPRDRQRLRTSSEAHTSALP